MVEVERVEVTKKTFLGAKIFLRFADSHFHHFLTSTREKNMAETLEFLGWKWKVEVGGSGNLNPVPSARLVIVWCCWKKRKPSSSPNPHSSSTCLRCATFDHIGGTGTH